MTRAIYFDCPTGISGDMALGALVDLGLPIAQLREQLASLPLSGWQLEAQRVTSYGLSGTRIAIAIAEQQHQRHLSDIRVLLEASLLPARVVARALAIFERLAAAEAQVHGTSVEQVHFHEVGAVDSILDIVGWSLGLDLLGVEEVYASALPLGSGWVNTQHGRLPVPAPATLALLASASAPTRPDDELQGELVTPTGAALLASCARFERPALALQRVGYGFGRRDLGRATAVRAWLGERQADQAGQPSGAPILLETNIDDQTGEQLAYVVDPAGQSSGAPILLETNIDDQTGEQLAYVVEQLLASGALDAWLTPVLMKKGRPAVVLSALLPQEQEQAATALLFRETTSLGLRRRPVERHICERELLIVETALGPVRVKRKSWQGVQLGFAPEYEDCALLARQHDRPLREIYELVRHAAGGA